RIKGLSSRQWRGLERGLAFKRQDRTPSVEEFLEELRFRKSHLPLIVGLTAVGAGLLTWVLLPQYLEKRRVDELITAIEQAALPQIPSILKGAVDLNEENQQSLAEKAMAQLMDTFSNGTAEQIGVALITLQKMPPDLKQEILSEGKDAILTYYQGQADSAFAPQEKRFDYITAEDYLTQVSALYPDSVQVFKTQQRMNEARNNLLNELDSRFNEHLAAGRLLPTPDRDDTADVLLILGQLDPKHPLLTDQRLAVAYTRQATTALDKGEYKQADRYVQTGLAIFPSDVALSNIQAKIQIAQKGAQNQAVLVSLRAELQQKIPTAKTLDDYRVLSEPLRQLRSLNPNDALLGQAEKGLQSLLNARLNDLIANGEWTQGENLLEEFSNQLSDVNFDALDLKLSKSQGGHEERSSRLIAEQAGEIKDRKADIERLITHAKYTNGWVTELTDALRKLENRITAEDPWLVDARERTGRLYLDQALKEREGKQFAKAGALLQQGQRFAPTMQTAFNTEQLALQADEQAWEKENQERARLAGLEGAKQSLLTQAKANDTTKALKTLEQLRGQLGANDPFLTTTGPEAIGRAYRRLAERRAKRNDFTGAIKLIENGLEVAPSMSTLHDSLKEYNQEAAIKVERTAFTKTPAAKIGSLKSRLEALKQQYPKRYPKALDEFATILAKRVDKISDAKAAQKLLDAARKLLPNSKKLQSITIKQPPQPSVIAAKGLSEVKAGRLSSARKLLDQAKSKEAGHPDLKRLTKEFETKRAQAEAAFGKYQRALKANNRAGAKVQLKQAMAIWNDNPAYKKSASELSKVKVATTPGYKERCNPKFAGYGKRSSKFRCSDPLGGKSKGPIMVVVPPGGGHSTPYAIGRYEISIGDYNLYCKLSGACPAISGKEKKLPVTGITLSTAQAYAAWLSGTTGATYRLPNESEWVHATTSSGGQFAGSDFNCLLQSGGATVKGGVPVNVNTAPQNPWGLYNYVGNVQEWISGGTGIKVIGGHFNDPADSCAITLVRNHSGGADELTGFRLLREIKH
ncbi:MAG: SUMF1/EgtB/PvdO family nonheme iron enzyme, partial [Sedimenticola sp.]